MEMPLQVRKNKGFIQYAEIPTSAWPDRVMDFLSAGMISLVLSQIYNVE